MFKNAFQGVPMGVEKVYEYTIKDCVEEIENPHANPQGPPF